MNFLQDYVTFTIDKRYEDRSSKSGIILLNTAWMDEEESERFQHKRLYGDVVSIPYSFSDTKIRPIDPGLPNYKTFVGHDWIEDKIQRGYTNHSQKDYYPSTFEEFEFVTLADIAALCNIFPGDRIYFDEKVTEQDNFLGKHQDKLYYRACINEVFCVVRNKTILMQGGWVLVEPEMETEADRTTKSGIITKTTLEAKLMQGTIRHVRDREDMKAGAKILYIKDADWKIKVEDKEYYVIQEDDILAERLCSFEKSSLLT